MNKIIVFLGSCVLLFVLFLCIPVPRFNKPYSSIVNSSDGRLLSAVVASDGQWRFPPSNVLPARYLRCLTQFEDKWFFYHCGFNPVSFIKAAKANFASKRVVSGGSTISMQVVRLAREKKTRTYSEKIIELVLAIRLELKYSKTEILNLYAANAPFGGNVVGIDAAAWRYFNTSIDRLSWSECAMLAILPNAPSLIHLGKNREFLKVKRDKLLLDLVKSNPHLPKKIKDNVSFSKTDYDLACMENIPDKPCQLPFFAYHFSSTFGYKFKNNHYISGINYDLQIDVNNIVLEHYKTLSGNGIENLCVYVIDYLEEKIVAYVGNCIDAKEANMVDLITAQRSTGSILKPFLYASMLDDGYILPQMMLPDIPINIYNYTPKNYSGEFLGAVSADEALYKSLNMPFVYLLRNFGVERFCDILKLCRISGLKFNANHYGLSVILGGAEANIYDITNAYASMARKLYFYQHKINKENTLLFDPPFSPAAISLTFQAMTKVVRPVQQNGWQYFNSVAWKTGTSFGFRDAWSVGVVDRYAVGVWAGNADGEGRAGLTGVTVAAPILFEVIDRLHKTYSFPSITEDAIEVEVCAVTGFPKSQLCPETKIINIPNCDIKTGVCPYHKKVFLDKSCKYRVSADCYDVDPNNYCSYFVLPPVMEWFYKKFHFNYKLLPPELPNCKSNNSDVMSFIYPEQNLSMFIPTNISGEKQQIIFEIAHRNSSAVLYWNLNEKFLGTTYRFHQMPVDVAQGEYIMKCTDEAGNTIVRQFKIVDRY